MIKTIKTIHTIIWIIMVLAIFYIIYCGLTNTFNLLLGISIGLILLEGLVLILNKGICPFTPLAMKYTSDRSDNFDMYIPKFIAKYNKAIFGILFIIGLILIANNLNKYIKI